MHLKDCLTEILTSQCHAQPVTIHNFIVTWLTSMRFLSAPMEKVNGPGPEKWPHTKHTDTCTTKRPTETRHALLKESKKWVTSILSDLGTLRHIWWPGRLFPAPYRLHCVPMIARWRSYHRHTPSPTTNKRTSIVPHATVVTPTGLPNN